jgi:hypothetical protein
MSSKKYIMDKNIISLANSEGQKEKPLPILRDVSFSRRPEYIHKNGTRQG